MRSYKLNWNTTLRAFLAVLIITFSTWAFARYESFNKKPHHDSFAAHVTRVDTTGSKPDCQCQLAHLPLYQPNVSQEQLLAFTTEAVMSAFTYDFNDYRRHFQHTSSRYFTQVGWSNFITKLRESGNLSAVIDNKLVVKAVPTDAPYIVSQGMDSGIYSWTIQMPLLLVYQGSGQEQTKQNLVVKINVRRTGNLEGQNGIAIDNMIATPRKERVV